MKTIKILLSVFFIVAVSTSFAQKKLSDQDRISILPYVSDQVEYLPAIAKNNLQSKLAQIVSRNGFGSSTGYSNRFIITPNISVLNKYIVSGAPPKVSLELEIALFVGDGYTGTKYGSTFISAKGVGKNETKAFISAVKTINAKNPGIIALLNSSKEKIMQYYNDCDIILNDIDQLVNTERYDEAIALINSVPSVSKSCYNRVTNKIKGIYRKKINFDCKVLLSKAEAEWMVGQNLSSARAAGEYLSQINPSSSCYNSMKSFYNKINSKLDKRESKAWNFVLKRQENLNDYKNEELKAMRAVNVARAKNQPKEIYNIRGWW